MSDTVRTWRHIQQRYNLVAGVISNKDITLLDQNVLLVVKCFSHKE